MSWLHFTRLKLNCSNFKSTFQGKRIGLAALLALNELFTSGIRSIEENRSLLKERNKPEIQPPSQCLRGASRPGLSSPRLP